MSQHLQHLWAKGSKQNPLVQAGAAPADASPWAICKVDLSAEEETSDIPSPSKSVLACRLRTLPSCSLSRLGSPQYLNDVSVTPHWGQRGGSGLVGKIPTSSKHCSGGHHALHEGLHAVRMLWTGAELLFAVLQGHVRAVPGSAPKLRDLSAPRAGTDLTQSRHRSHPAAASAPFCSMKAFQTQTCCTKCVAVPLVPILITEM